MKFITGAITDIGIKKEINQDSLTVRIGKCNEKSITMSILCDGMGGLQNGEVASATIVNRLIDWSDNRLPQIVSSTNAIDAAKNIIESVRNEWESLLKDINTILYQYGKDNNVTIGSTITGVFIVDDQYIVVNVGDSRTYLLDDEIFQITKDQSLIEREIELGRLTREQALLDPRRNVLLQCVGVTPDIEIDFYTGAICSGQGLLLCSDGMRHMVKEEEMFAQLEPEKMMTERDINDALKTLVQMNKERQETDNISAVYIKAV